MRASVSFCTFTLFILSALVSGCSSLPGLSPQRKVMDPSRLHSSDGFQFRFGMPGSWYVSVSEPGLYGVGTQPLADGSSKLAIVRYGKIGTAGGQPMSQADILAQFRKEVIASATGGTVSEVQTKITEVKHRGASCLSFTQAGFDNKSMGKMRMSNDGLICLHPTRPYTFIWMGISERKAPGKELSDLTADKKEYFETLDFN